jgi:hypothetical protein
MRSAYKPLLLLAVLVFIASGPARANHIDKGMSGLGDTNPATGCSATQGPCVIFNVLVPGQTATWQNFTFDGVQSGPFEFFEVPTSAPATFQLADPTTDFGTVTCGFSPQTVIDLQGFCTTIGEELDPTIDPNGFLAPGSLVPNSAGQVTLDFTGIVSAQASAAGFTTYPTYWVFYATEGTTLVTGTSGGGGGSPVPEPASLFLLGSGLFAYGAYKRRKSARTQTEEPAPL